MSAPYARSLQRVVELLRLSPLLARERGTWDAAAQGGRALARRRAHALGETAAERVHISDACAKRLCELMQEEESAAAGGTVLRVAVEGGGCSGFQYRFVLGSPAADDRVFEHGGARVAVDPVSFAFLKGATVHYSEELIRAAFLVKDNPNSEAACGCGSSFAAKASPPGELQVAGELLALQG